jgi:transcriptional regulator with XRE-family HTH domain
VKTPMNPSKDPQYAKFLDRLRAARKQAGLTQAEVASRLGRPQSFVSKSESGERRVDAVELARFARLYGRRVGFFLGQRGDA